MARKMVMALRLIPHLKTNKEWGFNRSQSRIIGSLPVYDSIEKAREDWPDDTELWEITIADHPQGKGE